MAARTANHSSWTSPVCRVRRFRHFPSWVEARERTLATVADDDMNTYQRELTALPLSLTSVYRYRRAVRLLWAYRTRLPEYLTADPPQSRAGLTAGTGRLSLAAQPGRAGCLVSRPGGGGQCCSGGVSGRCRCRAGGPGGI